LFDEWEALGRYSINLKKQKEPSIMTTAHSPKKFSELNLRPEVLQALTDLGFENPSSIQEAAIPPLLAGRDLIGQAKTGTGKTLAFSGPALSLIDPNFLEPQAIILAPTRELALQVAESLQSYASHLPSIEVLAVYGGQGYREQLRALKDGVQIVVGTPGRVMDMIERGALNLSSIKMFVLDEADEMLKMGFIDDVEWILQHAPETCQRALFSATMPPEIKKVASRYLRNPEHIQVKSEERSTSSIEQFYSVMHWEQKPAVLCRFLALEHTNATLIFTRTKNDSSELAEKLIAKGYKAAAINGDMTQPVREKVIQSLKNGTLDIVVATDVAARGLDVDRIELVVNFDLPFDVESYVHRIGRTGRAGRSGKALSLLGHKDLRMMRIIQKQTGFGMQEVSPPTTQRLKAHARERLSSDIQQTIANLTDIDGAKHQLASLQKTLNCDIETLAAALLNQKLESVLGVIEEITPSPAPKAPHKDRPRTQDGRKSRESNASTRDSREARPRFNDRNDRPERMDRPHSNSAKPSFAKKERKTEAGMITCTMSLGRQDKISPADIVGFIASRCNIDRKMIGRIDIDEKSSRIDLSDRVARDVVKQLGQTKFKRQPVSFSI
jgi:ATP-dependent RNA helicase DeaD